jgi:hypothetical protein
MEIDAPHPARDLPTAPRSSTTHRRDTTPPSHVASLRLLENKSSGRPQIELARPLLVFVGPSTSRPEPGAHRTATPPRLRSEHDPWKGNCLYEHCYEEEGFE